MTKRSFVELFALAQSAFFYAADSGESGQALSHYAAHSRVYTRSEESPFNRENSLTFDVSNNYVQASLDIMGTIQAAQSARGLTPYKNDLRGVFVQKEMIGSGPWKLDVVPINTGPVLARTKVRTGLLGNLLPLTSFTCGSFFCQILTFAPLSTQVDLALPVVFQVLRVSNPSPVPQSALIRFPSEFSTWDASGLATDHLGCSGLVQMDALKPQIGSLDIDLEPGEERFLPFAWILAANPGEVRQVLKTLRQKASLDWLEETLAFHESRLGRLNISEPYYADALVRMQELCRQAGMRLPDGSFAGGTHGSNANPGPSEWWNRNVWMKDNFYTALAMAYFDPRQCEKAILFFKEWGVPQKTWGRGLERFPHSDPLVQSLSNSLSSLILAAAYYQTSANRAFFLEQPDFLSFASSLLSRVEAAALHPGISLFPSMYISDGDARGDFHTGSNLAAWYCFDGMARLFREVFLAADLADHFDATAKAIRRDLQARCAGEGPLGWQYFEGATVEGSFIPLHDGEESDLALMPFYGFSDASDPALTRFSRLGLSQSNPYFIPAADGIAWFDGGFASDSTFPGFTSALAGAETETELLAALERIRRLTDLDGSIWWWPHRSGCKNPADVSRFPNKCGWAAGVYTLKFVNDILGIRVDAPARKISLAPFLPWESFAWQDCRIGSVLLDAAYAREAERVWASLTNRNTYSCEAAVELLLPQGAAAAGFQINGEKPNQDTVQCRMRYNRESYSASLILEPGQILRLEIQLGGPQH